MNKEQIRSRKFKDLAYEAYGGYICRCCGETERKFLTLDHINNDGFKNRKFGVSLYIWLKNNNYPSVIQVLFFNCNCGKSLNGGVCPHKKDFS